MKTRHIVFPLILGLVIVVLGLPLLGAKFLPTHDGEYHIIRFMEFFKMLSYGYLFPRWAPTLNSGFGLPIFSFHYPFPNYIGSIFHAFGFEFVDAFKLTLFSGYAVAGIFCYLFLQKLWDKKAAFLGTIASLAVPYWFLDMYVRGSVGEVWAITWMFAALASIVWEKPKLLSVAVGLLVLSHNIQAMVFLPGIFFLAWIVKRSNILFIFLGLILSSYFWIPALVERSYVVGLNIVNPQDHFASIPELLIPSWGTAFSGPSLIANKMSFQIGVLPLVWCFLGLTVFFKQKNIRSRLYIWFLLIGVIMAIFLMLPYSAWLWTTIPGVSYIQYPWRLLSIFIPLVAIACSYVVFHAKGRYVWILIVLSVVMVYRYSRPAMYERRDDAYYASRPNFTDGTSSMGNTFSTIWTPWKPQKAEHLIEVLQGEANVISLLDRPIDVQVGIDAKSDTHIRINRLYFPGWQVYDQHKPISIEYQSDGLINISLSAGTHELSIRYEQTPIRKLADALSLAGLLWLLGSSILEGIYAYRHTHRSNVRRA